MTLQAERYGGEGRIFLYFSMIYGVIWILLESRLVAGGRANLSENDPKMVAGKRYHLRENDGKMVAGERYHFKNIYYAHNIAERRKLNRNRRIAA